MLSFLCNVLVVMVTITLTFLADYTENDNEAEIGDYIKVLIVHCQLFIIITDLNIPWPNSITVFQGILSAVTGQVQGVSACARGPCMRADACAALFATGEAGKPARRPPGKTAGSGSARMQVCKEVFRAARRCVRVCCGRCRGLLRLLLVACRVLGHTPAATATTVPPSSPPSPPARISTCYAPPHLTSPCHHHPACYPPPQVYAPSCVLGNPDATGAEQAQVDVLAGLVTPAIVIITVASIWIIR